MRDQIIADLSTQLDGPTVRELLTAYSELVSKHRSGDLEGALTKAGRFVEHALRLIEGKRLGTVPAEIKSVATTVKLLEGEATLPEPLRLLIPRALYGMIYNIRSKRDGVHVKEVDPRGIDLAMAVTAAGWVIAELLRLYHVSDEAVVSQRMLSLTRASIPFVESLDGETFVGQKVRPQIELLLLLAHANPDGLTRRVIGATAKCSAPDVTKGLQSLEAERLVHQSTSGAYFITSAGESYLAEQIAGGTTPVEKRKPKAAKRKSGHAGSRR
jgi:hypothetical protein